MIDTILRIVLVIVIGATIVMGVTHCYNAGITPDMTPGEIWKEYGLF